MLITYKKGKFITFPQKITTGSSFCNPNNSKTIAHGIIPMLDIILSYKILYHAGHYIDIISIV